MTDQDTNVMVQTLRGIWTSMRRLQWTLPNYEGGLIVRVFVGGTPAQGSMALGTGHVPIDSGSNSDYLTDINIWSRGSVSASGSITPNVTTLLIGSVGLEIIPLAPGESITLRRKNPTQVYIKTAQTSSGTDSWVIFW